MKKKYTCKKCKKAISEHNKFLHDGMCDDCYFDEYFPDEFIMLPILFSKEKKNIKTIFNNEEEYASFLCAIEETIALGYFEDKSLDDKKIIKMLKNIKANLDKPLNFFKIDFEKEIMYSLCEELQEKKISKHELILVIDYILWAIDNRSWMQDKQAYVKWISYHLETMENDESIKYIQEIQKLSKDLGLSKQQLEVILNQDIDLDLPDIDMDETKTLCIFFSMSKKDKEKFLIENGTFHMDILMGYIDRLYTNKKNDEIKDLFKKIIEKNLDFIPYYIMASDIHNSLGEKNIAKEYLNDALKITKQITGMPENIKEEMIDKIKKMLKEDEKKDYRK